MKLLSFQRIWVSRISILDKVPWMRSMGWIAWGPHSSTVLPRAVANAVTTSPHTETPGLAMLRRLVRQFNVAKVNSVGQQIQEPYLPQQIRKHQCSPSPFLTPEDSRPCSFTELQNVEWKVRILLKCVWGLYTGNEQELGSSWGPPWRSWHTREDKLGKDFPF